MKGVRQKTRKSCSVCDAPLPSPIIIYRDLPLTGIYAEKNDPFFGGKVDQFFHICARCGHGQISNHVDPSRLYGDKYFFRTSSSATATRGLDRFVAFLDKVVGGKRYDRIVDIGCNDLVLLNRVKDRAERLFGIDPIWEGCESGAAKTVGDISLIGKVAEEVEMDKILGNGPALILSTHTLEHIAEPRPFIERLFRSAPEKSLFVFEFPGFTPLLRRARFDQIFHQHIQYFTLSSFEYLLHELGGRIIASSEDYHHWGSILVAFRRTRKMRRPSPVSKKELDRHIKAIADKHRYFKSCLQEVKFFLESCGTPVYGYGASLMLPALFYHLKLKDGLVEKIIDDDEKKQGLTYINLPVSIVAASSIRDVRDSSILITAPDNARPILGKAAKLGPKNIVMPLNIF